MRSRDPNADYPEGWVFWSGNWHSPEGIIKKIEGERRTQSDRSARYQTTAAGFLATMRANAKKRGNQ